MPRIKTFTNGERLYPADLNAIQDDYLSRNGAGPTTDRPAANAVPAGSSWLDAAGLTWRSTGTEWRYTGGIAEGPLANRPAPAVLPNAIWRDQFGVEWRSTGTAWIVHAGVLPRARVYTDNGSTPLQIDVPIAWAVKDDPWSMVNAPRTTITLPYDGTWQVIARWPDWTPAAAVHATMIVAVTGGIVAVPQISEGIAYNGDANTYHWTTSITAVRRFAAGTTLQLMPKWPDVASAIGTLKTGELAVQMLSS